MTQLFGIILVWNKHSVKLSFFTTTSAQAELSTLNKTRGREKHAPVYVQAHDNEDKHNTQA